jgi:hypothetical protein
MQRVIVRIGDQRNDQRPVMDVCGRSNEAHAASSPTSPKASGGPYCGSWQASNFPSVEKYMDTARTGLFGDPSPREEITHITFINLAISGRTEWSDDMDRLNEIERLVEELEMRLSRNDAPGVNEPVLRRIKTLCGRIRGQIKAIRNAR